MFQIQFIVKICFAFSKAKILLTLLIFAFKQCKKSDFNFDPYQNVNETELPICLCFEFKTYFFAFPLLFVILFFFLFTFFLLACFKDY